jgi:hypothetical protein
MMTGRCAYSLFAISLFAFTAQAAPECKPLAKVKAMFDATTHFTPLTPGQINFARGAYVATPPVSDRLPAGDAAILAEHDGDKGGVILWTRGPLVCEPTPVGDSFIKAMKKIKTGALDADGGEI